MFNQKYTMFFRTLISFLLLSSFMFADPTDGCDLDTNQLFLTSDGDVLYNSEADIGGFQFTVDGASVTGASGGAAAAAGFTVSAGGSTVLGFSFTGASIPSGCGTLTNLAGSEGASGLSGIVMSDPSANSIPFTYWSAPVDPTCDDGLQNGDEEGVDCGGSCDACDDSGVVEDGCDLPIDNLYLMGGDVLYNSSSGIAGFQFTVDGTTASGASGGDAAAAGFTVSTGGSTVLGFSFTGATIPAGCGTLTALSLDGSATGLSGIVVSDASGNAFWNVGAWKNIYFRTTAKQW